MTGWFIIKQIKQMETRFFVLFQQITFPVINRKPHIMAQNDIYMCICCQNILKTNTFWIIFQLNILNFIFSRKE